MKMRLALATLALAALPTLAAAQCMDHDTTASSCAAGKTWDSATKACVDTTT